MKTLYLDLSSGVSGDMFAGALYALLDEDGQKAFAQAVSGAGLQRVDIRPANVLKGGIRAVKMDVLIDGAVEGTEPHSTHEGHHGHSLADVEAVIAALHLPDDVKRDMVEIYESLAEAEAAVHGTTPGDIHFHEVGTIDAIADVMNAALLMHIFSPDRVVASTVNVGRGRVHCAHGLLPVPAPATGELLRGLPICQPEDETGELTTPTGAALIRHYVSAFGPMPAMVLDRSGFGAGDRDLAGGTVNALHALIGNEVTPAASANAPVAGNAGGASGSAGAGPSEGAAEENDDLSDIVREFVFTVDDMTGEDLAFAADTLRDGGALDVYFEPIFMKKGRPAYLVTVLCPEAAREELLCLIFRHTSTIGVREYRTRRAVLQNRFEKRHTSYGDLTVKVSEGYGVTKEKVEYEDLATAAAEHDIGIRELREALRKEL